MITRISAEAKVGHAHVIIDGNIDDRVLHVTINGVSGTFPTVASADFLEGNDPDSQIEGFNMIRALLEATRAASLT